MRTFTLLVVALVVFPVALAQKPQHQDGYWWERMTADFKVGWVDGYTKAMDTAALVMAQACLQQGSVNKAANCVKAVRPGFDFEGIAFGQFVEGIDAFYRDYRNKGLDVAWAIRYARDSIKGKSAGDLEAEITMWRRCYAEDAQPTDKVCTPETPSAQQN